MPKLEKMLGAESSLLSTFRDDKYETLKNKKAVHNYFCGHSTELSKTKLPCVQEKQKWMIL